MGRYSGFAAHMHPPGGARGLLAGALRRAATIVERKHIRHRPASAPGGEFLTWVRFAVPGMLEPGNIEAMDHAIAHLPAGKPILEIGSFCGLSTVVMTYLLERHAQTSRVYTCDKWEFEGQHLGSPLGDSPSVTHDAYRAYVRETFLRTMQTFCADRLPYTIECFSDEWFRRWFAGEQTIDVFDRPATLGGDLGFCYIDGNHSYACAQRDFEHTDRALVPGGFILFDDSSDGSHWEVNRLTREIASGDTYELVSRTPNYLFRKKDA